MPEGSAEDAVAVEQSAEDIVRTAMQRARENEDRVSRKNDPETAAFFKGIAAAYRSVVEENTSVEFFDEFAERRRTCPSCEGQGCDTCEGFGYVRVEVDDGE